MRSVTLDGFTTAVATHLALPVGDTQRDQLGGPVAAALAVVAQWHGLEVPGQWPDQRYQGAVMLAAKLHRRRNSPDTIQNDQGYGPMYVAKYDPDISMLLGLDRHMTPKAL